MSRPNPVDTLPHLPTAALLNGIEAAAQMLSEIGVSGGAPPSGTEADMILTSLLQYTECLEARLRPRERRGDLEVSGRCTSIGLGFGVGEDRLVRCELRADHKPGTNHQATSDGVSFVWDWNYGWDRSLVEIGPAPRTTP